MNITANTKIGDWVIASNGERGRVVAETLLHFIVAYNSGSESMRKVAAN